MRKKQQQDSKFETKAELAKFTLAILEKNYAEADKYLHNILSKKLGKRIRDEYQKPIF